MRLLVRREQQLAVLDSDVLALEVDRFAGEQIFVDRQEFARHLVTLVMRQKYAVAFVLGRIATGDHIDQQPAVRDAVERRGHAGRHRRRLQTGPYRDQIAELARQRRQRRCDDPGIFAAPSRRQQHAEVAEIVGGLGDLPKVMEVDGAPADLCSQVTAVAMRRQKPEDVRARRNRDAHEPDRTASETLIAFGTRPSWKNVSAIFCCSASVLPSIGLMP